MKISRIACAGLTAALLLAGCATFTPGVATETRISGDVVTVRYGQVEADYSQSNAALGGPAAARQCRAQGFESAVRQGAPDARCDIAVSYAGCYHWVITEAYRCIGGKAG
jgi:starvation-inducible outer membrane lipoprotein